MGSEEKNMIEAYADGVNDYINNINLMSQSSAAKLLPLEFYALGIKEIEPWTPVDSICLIKLMNFHLSWNWS